MSRVNAVELVAHGVKCDGINCDVLIPVRNTHSMPTGFYLDLVRVTYEGNQYATPEQLFFHDKTCMLATLEFSLSSLTTKTEVKRP